MIDRSPSSSADARVDDDADGVPNAATPAAAADAARAADAQGEGSGGGLKCTQSATVPSIQRAAQDHGVWQHGRGMVVAAFGGSEPGQTHP